LSKHTRARKLEAKEARRRSIVSCARAYLAHKGYAEISLELIARKVGLTKGALYLYFPTREALFIEVLSEDLQAWLESLHARLDARPGAWTPPQVAELFLTPGGAGLSLMPILHTILERNVDITLVRAFKTMLLERTLDTAERLERSAPFLPKGSGARLLVCTHAVIMGFRQQADRGPTTDRVLKAPHFEPLRPAVGPALRDVLTAMLIGWGQSPQEQLRSPPWKPPRKSPSRSSASAAGSRATSRRTATSNAF
jgi:AcrR family transcriptional regulator